MSIGSIGSGLQSYLQGLSATAGTAVSNIASAASAAATSATTAASSSTVSGTSTGTTAAHRHHHSHAGMKAIQDAVSTALQQAQSTASNEDPDKIIEDAIAKIFKNGIASPSQTSAQDELTGNTEADANSAAGETDNSTSSFLQTLQDFGVSPQEFQRDFAAAVKDAQNGQVNQGTAFASFPTGSNVDVVA